MVDLARVVSVGIVMIVMVPVAARRDDESDREQRQQCKGFHFSSFPDSSASSRRLVNLLSSVSSFLL